MAGGPGGFNKLFIMIPVMLAARKIDAENPTTVYWLRIAYGSVQSICVLLVLYTYVKASAFASSGGKMVVYVPSAPTVSTVLPALPVDSRKSMHSTSLESFSLCSFSF
jgi:Phosphate transport (Pho88)